MNDSTIQNSAALPALRLAELQKNWLTMARSRLFRASAAQRATHILELGCGWGLVAQELARRYSAQIIGVDLDASAIRHAQSQISNDLSGQLSFIQADARCLSLQSGSQDIIFAQCAFLWIREPQEVLQECRRLLRPIGGRLLIIEPDYDGLLEYPPEIASRELWVSALSTVGADPLIGRKIAGLCSAVGLQCERYLLDRYEPPHQGYLDFLRELPLTAAQQIRIDQIASALGCLPATELVVHLPYWLITAEVRRESN